MYAQPNLGEAVPVPYANVGYYILGAICIPSIVMAGSILIAMRWHRCLWRFGFGQILCLLGCAISASIYGSVFIYLIENNDIQAAWIVLQFFRWMIVFTTSSLITFQVVIRRACTRGRSEKRTCLARIFQNVSDNWYMVYTVMIISIMYTPITILYTLASRTYAYSTGIPLEVPVGLELLYYILLLGTWFYFAYANYRDLPVNLQHHANFWQNITILVLSMIAVLIQIGLEGVIQTEWVLYEFCSVIFMTTINHVFIYIWIGRPFYYLVTGQIEKFRINSQKKLIIFSGESSETSEIPRFSVDDSWHGTIQEYKRFVDDIRNDATLLNDSIVFRDIGAGLFSDPRIFHLVEDKLSFQHFGEAYIIALDTILNSNDREWIIQDFPETSEIQIAIREAKRILV